MLEITDVEFDDLVGRALDEIPADLARIMDNVVVLVEEAGPPEDPTLLGLYEGTPLTERDGWYSGVLPDRITLFRGPILSICDTYDDVVHEVRVTVIHEVAHHVGIDDERLHELGWG